MSGKNAQIRATFERREGVPSNNWSFIPFATESMRMEYTAKSGANIDPSGNEGESEILEAHGTGSISGEFTSESALKLRAHMQEYNEVANVTAGVELWELRDLDEVNDTPVAYYKDSLAVGVSRDEQNNPSEYVALGAKASRMELQVSKFEYATMTHDFLFTRDTRSRKPHEQAVDAAWTGDIFIRGHRPYTDQFGDYYKFKVPLGGGGVLGVATFVWGKGAGAYSATPFVTATVMDVRDGADAIVGSPSIPYQILIDAPAGHVFTAGDEFYLYPTALKAVAAFDTRPRLHGAAALIEIAGVAGTYPIDEFTLQHGVPREAKGGIGSIFDQYIGEPTESKQWWEFSFNRTYLDNSFESALLHGAAMSVYAKLYGKKIGATAYDDFAEYELSNMKITAAGATVQNPGDNPETVTFRAFGAEMCVERYQNTVSSITPT